MRDLNTLTEREQILAVAIRQTVEIYKKQRTLLHDIGITLSEPRFFGVSLEVADVIGYCDTSTWYSQQTGTPCAYVVLADFGGTINLTTEGASALIERKKLEAKNELS